MGRYISVGACVAMLCGLLTTGAAARPAPAAQPSLSSLTTPEHVPGELVIRYELSATPTDRADLRAAVEADSVDPIGLARTEVLEVPKGSVDAAIAILERSPDVAFVEPNFIYRATSLPNDPRFPENWALHNTGQSSGGLIGTPDADIDAPEAWEATKGSRSIVVAVVDTGVAYGHPDLAPNIWRNPGEAGTKETNGADDDNNGFKDDWRGWDFVDDDNTPRDFVGHGTHVAGTIGASGNDGYGTVGVNWQVSLMPLRVLGNDGSGTTADVAAAITYAADNGADVVNLSLGGPDLSLTVSSAISAAPGVLISAAAGNGAANNDVSSSYPCNYPYANIVCVAATDSHDNLAGYSNYGLANVDLAAPGSGILSTMPAFRRAVQENFEADISATWVAGGTGTQWSRGLDAEGYFVADSVGANYLPSSDSWLRMVDPVDLTSVENCQLGYSFELDTELNSDLFSIEGSRDGVSWGHLGGWTGSTGGDWLSATHDLTTKAGVNLEGGPLYLRLRLTSNLVVEREGVSLDDLSIKCLSTSFTGTEFSYFSGTSMATPHVAGAAALVLSLAPGATVAEVRNALLGGVDTLSSLSGKVSTGGRLNVSKALGVLVPSSAPDPLPDPLSTPTPTPTPTPTADETSKPAPTPTPSPSVSEPAPDDPPETGSTGVHPRAISFDLRQNLVAVGSVTVANGFDDCSANVMVKIKRWGKTIAKGMTGALGRYRITLPRRPGRYVAKAPRVELPGDSCEAATSRARQHLL